MTTPRTGPIQRHPLIQDGNLETFQRAHEMADVNAGDNAIHHTLGVTGGGARFEHVHGTPLTINTGVPILGTPAPNFGDTGTSKLFTRQFDNHIMYWRYEGVWGGSGRTLGDGYYFTMPVKPGEKSHNISLTVEALVQGEASLFILGALYRGKVTYDTTFGMLFNWDYQRNTSPDGVYQLTTVHGLSGTPNSGDVLAAQGIIQYA